MSNIYCNDLKPMVAFSAKSVKPKKNKTMSTNILKQINKQLNPQLSVLISDFFGLDKIQLDKVLMVADGDNIQFGKPYLDKVKVSASVLGEGRHKKVNIIKLDKYV